MNPNIYTMYEELSDLLAKAVSKAREVYVADPPTQHDSSLVDDIRCKLHEVYRFYSLMAFLTAVELEHSEKA